MPYEMKNRFLILGLTGPLGSGCTTTAKFLSGMNGNGKKLLNLIRDQLKLNVQTEKNIKAHYNKIKNTKVKITELISKQRKLKDENQQFGTFYLDKHVENKIESLKNTLDHTHKDLKNLLYIREVNKTLKEFSQSEVFRYKNLNSLDKEIFGFNPFVYISFTTFIVKLAFESFFTNNGEKEFEAYFKLKLIKYKDQDKELSNEFQRIKENIQKQFKSKDGKQYQSFSQANQFVSDRNYFILTDYHTKEKRLKSAIPAIRRLHKKIVPEYFLYIKFINRILENIKLKRSKKRLGNYQKALSEVLQDWGDNIRKNGNAFDSRKKSKEKGSIYKLSNEINLAIKFLRYRIRFVGKNYDLIKRDDKTENKPLLIVLECFRNPYEVDFFRSRYSEFYLISLFADNFIRGKRAKNFTKNRDDRDKGIDKEPSEIHKLDVNSCVLQSDISINNNEITKNKLFKKFLRYFCLIRNPGCLPPNDDELFMHLAYSLSLKSTCISRKVGAVIIGPKGYIYGAGWNDVSEGQIGCGLRTKDDYLNINSIPKIPNKFDPKAFYYMISNSNGEYICYKDIMSKIDIENKRKNQSNKGKNTNQPSAEINVKRLEYCRALHAEENALLQLAKIGGNSIVDGTIYTTTYPCELCAKKIYQTGIRTIFYTEPYPETISEEVFLEDGSQKIEAIQFEGVKSNSFYKFFKPLYDKKELSKMNI